MRADSRTTTDPTMVTRTAVAAREDGTDDHARGPPDEGSGPLSARYDDALAYASEHDRKQLRKGSQVPYLTHLMSVSALVLEHGGSEDQASPVC